MNARLRIGLAALATAAMTIAPAGLAQARSSDDGGHDGHHAQHTAAATVFTLPGTLVGNPEGVAWDKRGKAFYVGATGDGAIFRGTLDSPTLVPFIAGATGNAAVGMKVSKGKLYVAGGGTGTISVYDLAAPATAPVVFNTGTGGFVNDLVITEDGDLFATDSFRATIWQVTKAQLTAGTGTPTAISLAPDVAAGAGVFRLNGIVSLDDGKKLVVVNSSTGQLFRVKVKASAPLGRTVTMIDAPLVKGGDGLLVDRGRLVVVIGSPASLTFLKLRHHGLRASVDMVHTDPTLRGPSTVARAKNLYLVVNADFTTNTKPFTVSGLPRHAHDHD